MRESTSASAGSGGEAIEVQIEKLSHEGRGIARIGGKTVFIDGALPGEVVEFRYTRRRGRHDEGFVTRILTSAADRVDPRCPHFGICGGCSLQHLDARSQLQHKQRTLMEHLESQAGITPANVLDPVSGPSWGYRHKARLSARYVTKKGRLVLGFTERRTRLVADIERCEVLHPVVGERLATIRTFIERLSVVKHVPQVEIAVAEHHTALIIRHLTPLTEADIAVCRQFAASEEYVLYSQGGGMDSIVALWPLPEPQLDYSVLNQFKLGFQPNDFTQVNRVVNNKLVERVLDLLNLTPQDEVLDLFCGLGNFTIPLSARCHFALGIEGDARLVARARQNAVRNNRDNVEFIAGNLNEPLPIPMRDFTKVVLDPPRTGAAEIIRRLVLPSLKRLVYVSCNPSTLARDARILRDELGFEMLSAGVLDMFPQTAHVESIGLFLRA